MADLKKRIIALTEKLTLAAGDFIAVDNASGGTKKFALTEATSSKAGLMAAADKAALDGAVEDVADLKNDMDEVRTNTRNLFDPQNVINAYFTGTNTKINIHDNARLVFAPCKPNTQYTVSKIAGTRFSIGYTKVYPVSNTQIYGVDTNYTGASLTVTTGADAAYVVAWVWNVTSDTITDTAMLASVQIEEGGYATPYIYPFTAVDRSLRESYVQDTFGAFQNRISSSHGGIFTNDKYENSPKAFLEARKQGVLYQDIDVVFTSDLVPIISHSSFADNAIRKSDNDTSRIYFRDYTITQLKENYWFGDSEYKWTIQTLEECYKFNRELGCYLCIDIGAGSNNPTGSREGLIAYMIEHGIECEYLVTSELDTFSILTAATGAERFPLGVVVAAYGETDTSSTDTTATAVSKINAIISAKSALSLGKAWCIVRRERMESGGDLVDYVDDLLNNQILIGGFSYNRLTYNTEIPSYFRLVTSQYLNVNYRRYLDLITNN